MVSNNAPQQFQLVSLQTNPPTIIGTYSTIVACRAAANGLSNYEIFWSAPKQQRPGPGGIMTDGSPNVTFRKSSKDMVGRDQTRRIKPTPPAVLEARPKNQGGSASDWFTIAV